MASKGKKPIRRTTTRSRKGIKNPSPPCSISSDVTSTSTIPASGCCTPISKKSRIPEMLTCPPAPKKQKVAQNFALSRRQISFFAPPDVELFLLFAHGQQIKKIS
ncbi:hypothetical protein BRARA_H00231 [Brassica rapa]|uniref:BnaAnng22290D protein n=4 Tax=Brassica TaxID=3705 RepID=A0A078JFS4_BRANA|nr:cyclin-dependent protein kinase inhibitor SMR9 [Brassica napus]KAG5387959.1 hypothetical protein IGI04_029500 [Brassica rapa subsp. trilocularis]KAH0914038.1 hypothetical protein HID58_028484 [Brassica napus]RID49430.1 hypothetical protein BRARA_H00231 [Brassica rapa]CDY66468.1 BnaAnng22290D [Brassica napus]